MQQWQSWALSCVGVIGIYLTGRKNWRGYAVGIFTECAWVWYALVTKQYGFIFGSTIYVSVYLFNINKWINEAKAGKIRSMFHINPLHNYNRKNENK